MRIVVDPGHGGSDPGATFRGHREKDLALAVSLRLASLLSRSRTIEVKLTRDADTYPSLVDRVNLANEWDADLYLSVHLNADPDADRPGDPEARGHENWYYQGSIPSMKFARRIGQAMREEFPDEPYRGEKSTKGIFVLRKTRMTAVLAEIAFIDNSTSVLQVSQPETQEAIAFALMRGVLDAQREQL